MSCLNVLMRCLVAMSVLWTAAAAPPPKPAPKKKPPTHTVRRETFRIEVATKGVFESRKMTPIAFEPKAWIDLVVREAAPAGKRVKKGEVILTLETEKIEEAISAMADTIAVANVGIGLAEGELAAMKKSLPLGLAAAERAKKHADEDLARYLKTGRPLAVESAQFAVKRAESMLEYNQEELRQLEKMYKADDLTEETEEIVLKRQRKAVERAAFALKIAKSQAEQVTKVDLPRKDVTVKLAAQQQAIALAKAKATASLTLRKTQLDLEKLRRGRKESVDKLAKLKGDLKAMVVRAKADGVVYYGPCLRGRWAKLTRSLDRGTKVLPREVVMTLVDPRAVRVLGTITEGELRYLRVGMTAKVTPVAFPDSDLAAKVESVSVIPVAEGAYGVAFDVTLPEDVTRIMPGMNCGVKVLVYENKDALAVPKAAVVTEGEGKGKGKKTFVYVRTKPGRDVKRPVKVGQRSASMAEILSGLKEGEVVVVDRSKKAK